MAFRSGSKKRHVIVSSDDSESDIPLYKKERITKARKVQRNLQTFCDNDSLTLTSTDVTRRSNASNKNNNRSTRPTALWRTRIVSTSSESDTATVDHGKVTRGKLLKRKKSNVNNIQISESSSNPADSLIQNKETGLRSSNVNKQNNNKDSESEVTDCSQVVEDKSKEKKDKEPNIISSIPIGDSRVIEKQKEDDSSNFKPHVTKVMEEMKCKFARFISQISRLQQMYFKEKTVTLEDAEHIIFISTCIISKLKEEFTEYQHKLMDFCFQLSMKHNSKRTVSDILDKQFHNDNHLHVQRVIDNSFNSCNACSTNNDEPVFPQNTNVEQTLQATKSTTNNVQPSNKDLALHKNNKKSNTKSALENDNLISIETNKNNVVLQNSKSTSSSSISDIITKSNDRKGNIEGSMKDTSKTKDSLVTSTFSFRQPVKLTRSLSKNKLNTDDDMSQHINSDVDSTCSTLNFFSLYKVDKQQNNRTASSTNEYGKNAKNNIPDKITLNVHDDDTKSTSLSSSSCENIFPNRNSTKRSSKEKLPASNNSSQANSLYRIHSFDTLIIPSQTDNEDTQRKSINRFNSEETLVIRDRTSMNAKNYSFFRRKKIFHISDNDLLYESDRELIVPNADIVDKKLQMDCRVLIEKCNL